MAYFAELDENNIVLRVIVVHEQDCMNENGIEVEEIGAAFCQSLFGGTWKQTSNDGPRKNHAVIGHRYDSNLDAYIAPQPFPSWTLDESANWQPPVAMPTDKETYWWNEETQSWVEF